MERLSALDTEFLYLEDGISHMHIGGMSVFEGSPPSEDELRALLASKLHLLPRYRQRIRSVPLELGRPVWVDDPHFNLEYHVRSTALVEPVTDEAVCRLMGRVMSQELDRRRPLWECWIVHGLPGGSGTAARRWAFISKVHHCMVDGIAGVGLLEAVLSADPGETAAEPRPWTPRAEPSAPALVLDAWSGLLGDLLGRARALPGAVLRPCAAARSCAATAEGIVRFGQRALYTPPLSVDGTIGPHRVWAHAGASLDDVRRIRKSFGGTVNDVVLAAVTRGFRDLLAARGDDVERSTLRCLVPVSVRAGRAAGAAGSGRPPVVPDNRVSAILYELPIGIADPVERLAAVQSQMSRLKGSHMPEAGGAITSLADLVPPMVIANTSRLAMRVVRDHPQRTLNTVTTNVPGPQFPLYCLGREMVEHRPYVPISHGLRIGTAVLSYNGRLSVGVTGDYDTAPDVGVVAAGIAGGIEELVEGST